MVKPSRRLLLCIFLVIILPVLFKISYGSSTNPVTNFSNQEVKQSFKLEGDHISGDQNDAVEFDGTKVIIRKAGIYQFSGELEEGQIYVKVSKDEIVTLKLNNVNIHNSQGPAIYVASAKRVKIKLKGSLNYVSDGPEYARVPEGERIPRACIDSRDDLTIQGDGSLIVEGNYKNGIVCSDNLTIKSGNIQINAVTAAMRGNDSVVIKGGNLDLTAGKNGIYSAEKVKIKGGVVKIHAQRYGIFGRNQIYITNESDVSIQALSALAGTGEKTIPETVKTAPLE